MDAAALAGGFSDAPIDAAQAFRVTLDCLARPGTIGTLAGATPPAPLPPAAGVLALTLLDLETPLWLAPALRTGAVADWLRFHTGAPVTEDRSGARFALGGWADLLPLGDWPIGTPEYPDRSTTLIVLVDTLEPAGPRLTGPGIDPTGPAVHLSLPDPGALRANASLFPLGLDFFFAADTRVAGLPRTTKVEG